MGLCAQWTSEWGASASREEMAKKYVKGIDFCIKHDFPSVEVIKRDFGDIMHDYGVYADEDVHLRHPAMVVLNGKCTGSLECGNYDASNIYVRHNSEVVIRVKELAYVHISIYDKAKVTVECAATAKCFIYKYGGNISAKGNVVIRDRTEAGIFPVKQP